VAFADESSALPVQGNGGRGRPTLGARLVLVVLAMGGLGPACKQSSARASPSAAPSASASPKEPRPVQPTLLTRRALLDGISELQAAVGQPPQALELAIRRERLVLQAQNPKQPSEVLQYVYQDGKVSEPVPVELRGAGDLEDNLFPLAQVALERVPDLCEQARRKVDPAAGRVSHVLVRRNLPESMDVRFRVYVTSPAKDGYLDADRNGRAINP